MAGLLMEIAWKAGVSCLTMLLAGFAFPALLTLGENTFQTLIVLTTYLYCALSLFTNSAHKLFHVLSIPLISQFLHLFQKYDFTAGANSIWRLLPFILLDLFLLNFIIKAGSPLSGTEKLLLVGWEILNLFLLVISPQTGSIFFGGAVLYLFTVPLVLIYLQTVSNAVDFAKSIEMYLCLLYVILGLGTFGLVIAGASYKGSDNLLVTRNISDTNVTMAYFILLWPFALLYARGLQLRFIATVILVAILLIVVVISFSRGAAAIILPYIALSLLISFRPRYLIFGAVLILIIWLHAAALGRFFEEKGLAYSWQLRMQDYQRGISGIRQLQESSGRAAIHEVAKDFFLKRPAIGHGIGSFEKLGPGYREAHSLFYTWLAEEGLLGTIFKYGIFAGLSATLLRAARQKVSSALLFLAFVFYLLFNHTVGSVFFIIPAKSLTINCFAPVLLLCLYFYAQATTRRESQ